MKKVILPLLGILVAASLGAQTLQTSYLSDDFVYSYRLNPAFHSDHGFVGLPFLGVTSGAFKGDFSLNNFFYKIDGKHVSFADDAVSSEKFLGNFKKGLNKFNSENYVNLLAVGFRSGGLYNIVDFNIRNYNSGKLPYDLARFLKDGPSTDGNYDLSGLKGHSSTFFEIGITSSWKATRKLTVGVRFKGVIGFNNSYIDMDRMTIAHSGENWTVNSSGVIASAYDGFNIASVPSYYDPSVPLIDFHKTQIGEPKGIMNGYGVGADLGVLYDDSSWQLSASLSDIGCVFWFHNFYGHSPSQAKSYSEVYSSRVDMLGDAMNFIMEDEFQTLGLLPVTVRLGAKYLYLSDISFGGLATFRYDDICPFWDVRGSVNYKPVKQIELIGSLGAGSLGVSAGAFVNAKLAFLNIFAGTDNLLGTSGSTFIPSTKGAPNFVAGLNVIW